MGNTELFLPLYGSWGWKEKYSSVHILMHTLNCFDAHYDLLQCTPVAYRPLTFLLCTKSECV